MKRSVAMMACVLSGALMISAYSPVVFAETTEKTEASKTDEAKDESEKKEDTSKVYVHPVSGPAIYYRVQGLSNGSTYNASGKYEIPTGSKASITNYVYENRIDKNNNPLARLHMERKSYQPIDTTGYWSPDSIGTYTIYG